MVALTRAIPAKAAFEMLVTGDFIDAAHARDLGLVNRVVPPERLGSETDALARKIAGKLGAAVRIGKRAFHDQLGLPLPGAYALTGAVMAENMLWRDTEEGIAAFLDKRRPGWAD
jgi:enoyl-CoA hydratase/carnithine racemase